MHGHRRQPSRPRHQGAGHRGLNVAFAPGTTLRPFGIKFGAGRRGLKSAFAPGAALYPFGIKFRAGRWGLIVAITLGTPPRLEICINNKVSASGGAFRSLGG